MTDEPPAALIAPDEEALRLAEALVFASAGPVGARALSQLLPEDVDADAVIAALRERYAGRGVELVEAGGGVQFRTAPDLAPRLRKVIEMPRRLPRVAMETLAIIAYHQPVTRPEIEEIRGTSLSQQTLDALLEANLIAPKGRRESPGRPTLWGTTPQFLAQFGLKDLRELPRREDLLLEPPQPAAQPRCAGGRGIRRRSLLITGHVTTDRCYLVAMFDFAWSEIALIAVVALIAIGPKDMPVAIRAVTGWIKKARRMAAEFQTHVDEMVREADLHEVRASINEIRNFDIRGEIERDGRSGRLAPQHLRLQSAGADGRIPGGGGDRGQRTDGDGVGAAGRGRNRSAAAGGAAGAQLHSAQPGAAPGSGVRAQVCGSCRASAAAGEPEAPAFIPPEIVLQRRSRPSV